MVKLKVCGMKYPDNINAVNELHPDYMGFIFYENSPRFFEGLIPELAKSVQKVGVFVNSSIENVANMVMKHNLEVIQLHGEESVAYCQKLLITLKDKNCKLIKVFSVGNRFDFDLLTPYEQIIDYFLFDTKGENHGGNGIPFDWEILKNYPSQKPFFLSGGISLDNLKKIKTLDLPIYAIDVNSQFEIEKGLKNITLLKQLQNEISS